jgi:hypothetical protein
VSTLQVHRRVNGGQRKVQPGQTSIRIEGQSSGHPEPILKGRDSYVTDNCRPPTHFACRRNPGNPVIDGGARLNIISDPLA